jgi:cyclase
MNHEQKCLGGTNTLFLKPLMETNTIRKIVPSIYTADGQATTADTRHVKDYNQAMEQALIYEAQGADEIILMDVTSISERRRNLPRFLKDLNKKLTVPFVFGGGVHTVKDVEELLKYGAPRVYVNSAAVRNPELINKVSSTYGKQALLVAVDTRHTFGTWKVYLSGGKSRTEIDLINWMAMIENRGGSEVLISAITRGDHELVFDVFSKVTASTSLPVLASAGFTEDADYLRLVNETGVNGIVSAHLFQKENALRNMKALLNNHEIFTSPEKEEE